MRYLTWYLVTQSFSSSMVSYMDEWLIISMGQCKKDVTPLLTPHRGYVFHALTHRYSIVSYGCQYLSTAKLDVGLPSLYEYWKPWSRKWGCCNWKSRQKHTFSLNISKSRLPIVYFLVGQNFAQSSVVILTYTVRNVKTIGKNEADV